MSTKENELNVKRTGRSVTVPNNDVARLMYYLHCVCTSIDCNDDPDIQRFIDYNNWHYLSDREQRILLGICYKFSPDVFNGKVFFHSEELCDSRFNEFYQINQVRHQLLAAESIIIAGQTREVNQIMVYTMQWMRTYYFNPMERLASPLINPPRVLPYRTTSAPNNTQQTITYRTAPAPNNKRRRSRCPSPPRFKLKCTGPCMCWSIYCIVFVILPILYGITELIKFLR